MEIKVLLILTDRVTQGQRGVSTGHSRQGIRTSASLQEKFRDICGSLEHCVLTLLTRFMALLSNPLVIDQTRGQQTCTVTSSKNVTSSLCLAL